MTALELVKSNEGFRANVYCDSCGSALHFQTLTPGTWICRVPCKGGKLTIGYGTLLDGVGLSQDEATSLLMARLEPARAHLEQWSWYGKLAQPRQAALIDMVYQLGRSGFDQFVNLIDACRDGLFDQAAVAVMASLYARQTPARARRNAELLRSGTWI